MAAEHFTSDYQYTRGDGAKSGIAAVAEGEKDRDSNLMIFAGQAVSRGSIFVGGFVLKHVSAVEFGALLWSLRLWQADGGTIGGQAARCHGRLQLTLLGLDAAVEESAVAEYCEYAASVKDDAVAWLNSCFK